MTEQTKSAKHVDLLQPLDIKAQTENFLRLKQLWSKPEKTQTDSAELIQRLVSLLASLFEVGVISAVLVGMFIQPDIFLSVIDNQLSFLAGNSFSEVSNSVGLNPKTLVRLALVGTTSFLWQNMNGQKKSNSIMSTPEIYARTALAKAKAFFQLRHKK